jgi:hypothetical protein
VEKTLSVCRIELDDKCRDRERAIWVLVNILIPDPIFQPMYLSDKASVFDVFNQGEKTIRSRLEGYFGKELRFKIRKPLWSLIDEIREIYPGWPNDWEYVDRGKGPELVRVGGLS